MQRKTNLILWAALLVFAAGHAPAVVADGALTQAFRNPPEATKPRCYWYWLDGRASREGISRDLEAMRRVGIGAAYIGLIGYGGKTVSEPAPFSEPWWGNLAHAVREGKRTGVDIGLFNCPGWSQSGGPWVKPEQAMRYLVHGETRVKGPCRFHGKLPVPPGGFQPVTALAFPVPAGEDAVAAVTGRTPRTLEFVCAEPFTARSLTLSPAQIMNATAELKASDDGRAFRTITKFTVARTSVKLGLGPVSLAPVTVTFPAVTARHFRIDFAPKKGTEFSAKTMFAEVRLTAAARVADYAGKALLKSFEGPVPPFEAYTWPPAPEPEQPGLAIRKDAVLDLTGRVAADGTLDWEVPPGEWIVQYSGMQPTGTLNKPPLPGASGLEIDKMSRTHLRHHFDAYVGELLRRVPPAERTAWKYVVADSYETGLQNWTDGFRGDFRKQYGYDPLPFLPALAGRVVGSADATDRFLWDLRRLVADRIARDYVGGLRDLCHEHGLKLWLENYGHFGFPSEFLLYGGQSDEVSGEFWLGDNLGSDELRAAASAAHVYGRPTVWAEAFTARGLAFENTPRELKARGDWAFCQGINQFVLHVYIHQPREDRKPGDNAWFGTEFNRHNTWFARSKSWFDYLRRCSVLLQAGHPVADVACYIGEDTPKMSGPRHPAPPGYDYDYINADAILNRLEVKDGRFVLPDGTSYALLTLPDSTTMRPAVLKRLAALAAAGGTVVGPRPQRSPSLQNYPACDREVQELATAAWGDGSGKIISGITPEAALARLNLVPDADVPAGILWKHRRTADTDIYFLANQTAQPRTERVSFRAATARAAALWWPDSGTTEPVACANADGRTAVTVTLAPLQSVFVIFAESAPAAATARPPLKEQSIAGPWQVAFPGRRVTFDRLVSWTENADAAIKFHSGTATYSCAFEVADAGKQAFLDLGRVEALATVTLNGRTFPTLWTYPYRLDVTGALKPGRNELTVEVVNTWNNRLVGDAALPAKRRQTSLTRHNPFTPKTPLQAAGLLGPVVLHQVAPP